MRTISFLMVLLISFASFGQTTADFGLEVGSQQVFERGAFVEESTIIVDNNVVTEEVNLNLATLNLTLLMGVEAQNWNTHIFVNNMKVRDSYYSNTHQFYTQYEDTQSRLVTLGLDYGMNTTLHDVWLDARLGYSTLIISKETGFESEVDKALYGRGMGLTYGLQLNKTLHEGKIDLEGAIGYNNIPIYGERTSTWTVGLGFYLS